MMNVQFDTLKYSQSLREAGVGQEQAETHSKAIVELIDENLVTKNDLKLGLTELKAELETKMAQMEGRLEAKIVQAEGRLEAKISASKVDLIKWIAASMVTLLLSQFGLALTLIKFFSP